MDSLCNHKEAATRWADGETPICACPALRQHSPLPHQADQHLVLDGDNLRFADALLHLLLRAHFKTRSFHHPKRSTIPSVLL
jgi:hypothetical protein